MIGLPQSPVLMDWSNTDDLLGYLMEGEDPAEGVNNNLKGLEFTQVQTPLPNVTHDSQGYSALKTSNIKFNEYLHKKGSKSKAKFNLFEVMKKRKLLILGSNHNSKAHHSATRHQPRRIQKVTRK